MSVILRAAAESRLLEEFCSILWSPWDNLEDTALFWDPLLLRLPAERTSPWESRRSAPIGRLVATTLTLEFAGFLLTGPTDDEELIACPFLVPGVV